MPEALLYGHDCKLFVDSSASYAGTPGSPTWAEITDVTDLTVTETAEVLDVQPRAAGAMQTGLPGRLMIKISGTLHWTNGNAQKTALLAANMARSPLNIQMLKGASTNADAKGFKGDFFFSKFEEKQEAGKTVSIDFELTPYVSLRSNFVQTATGA